MNEEPRIPDLDLQLEARLVALVLGEVSDFERDELNRLIAQDPKLQAFMQTMEWVHGEVREVASEEWPEPEDGWKLSPERRRKVQMAITGQSPPTPSPVIDLGSSLGSSSNSAGFWNFTKVGVALAGVSVVALVTLMFTAYSYQSASRAVARNEELERIASGRRIEHWSFEAESGTAVTFGEVIDQEKSKRLRYESDFVAPPSPATASIRQTLQEGAVLGDRSYDYKDDVQFLPDQTLPGQASPPANEPARRFRYGDQAGGEFANSGQQDQLQNELAKGLKDSSLSSDLGLGTFSQDGRRQPADWYRSNGPVPTAPDSKASVWLSNDATGQQAQGQPSPPALPEPPLAALSDQPRASGVGEEVMEYAEDQPTQSAEMGMLGFDVDADVGGGQMAMEGGDVGGLGGAVASRGSSSVAGNLDPADRPSSGGVAESKEYDEATSDAILSSPDPSSSLEPAGQESLGEGLLSQDAFGAVVVPSYSIAGDAAGKAGSFFDQSEPLRDAAASEPSSINGIAEGRPLVREVESEERFDVQKVKPTSGGRGQADRQVFEDSTERIADFESLDGESPSVFSRNESGANIASGVEMDAGIASLYGVVQPGLFDKKQADGNASSLLDSEKLSLELAPAAKETPPPALTETNTADEPFSTFSLHVSDVSFKLAASALARGQWPEASVIRAEEFVNALDYGDPLPGKGEKVACRLEQCIHPFLQQRNLMRVSLRTAAAGRASSTPLRLTFVIDNSGSMERVDRQQTLRVAFRLLARQLQATDQVTLISFARQPRLLADKVSGDQSDQLVRVIESLPSEGGTNMESALQLALDKSLEQRLDGAQNRIIVLTDGAVNLGDADPASLSRMVVRMRDAGIAFDAAGISAEGLNDEILEALTRQGDGRYYLLDSPDDADEGFVRQIAGALRPSAKNVKVQVEFNPQRVERYKLIGFEKHLLDKEDFRDDTVDAAEMTAAEAGVAVYQFEAKPDGEGDIGSVSVRFQDLSTGQMVENRWPIPYVSNIPRIDQAAPSMRIAAVAALLAARLGEQALGQTVELKTLDQLLAELPAADRNMARVQQLQQMIQQARQLSGN